MPGLDKATVAAWWLVAVGLVSLPACATLQDPETSRSEKPALPKEEPNSDTPPTPKKPASPKDDESKPIHAEFSLPPAPAASSQGTPLPINLPTALALVGSNPLDIQIAQEQVRIATAQLTQANVLWIPNINTGVDYFRHDGEIQDIVGKVFTTSKSSFLMGIGPQAIVGLSDAVYKPLAASQVQRAAQAENQAVINDTTLAVAVAYFNVQQARGELAGGLEALRRAEDLVARTEKLAPDLTPEVEVNRAKTEAARRRQMIERSYERWQVASAELTRLLRLQTGTLVEPAEEPSLQLTLVVPNATVEELVEIGLTHRPELSAHQALVQAALQRTKQEKKRPLWPTLGVRGVSSNAGIAGGYFGGGINDFMGDFGSRFSVDLQAVWELQNAGFGNRAMIREREAQQRKALLQLLKTQDYVMAEVVQAHAEAYRANRRVAASRDEVANAAATADKNLHGLGQTKRVGESLILVFRPQEAVAAVAALDQAYRDYYQAVADANRAQFRLYRALGHPGQALCQIAAPVEANPPQPPTAN